MKEKSRTQYSAKNTTVSVACRMAAIFMGFVTRVVFTHTLNESYVGINGLFTDILNILAISEFGIGTAITFALYKPIADKDIERQKALMRMYARFYKIVAIIVLGAGLLVIPFMDVLIKNTPDVTHLTLIYLMYLANSAVSYLFIYKRTIIDAHQCVYIGIFYQTVFLLIQDVLQIVILLWTKNFILFLFVYILCTLGTNISIARKADKLYPYIKEPVYEDLPEVEKGRIYKNVRAMLMHKVGMAVVSNTDNLLLSSMVGIESVGKYSNYYLLIGSIRQIIDQVFLGITASVGNLGATEDSEKVRKIFETSFFMGQWLYGFAAICLFELLDPFVSLSFGTQYVFESGVVFVLCLNFYINGMRRAALVFRDSLGLFWYDRYKSVFEAAINLVVSVVLTLKFGAVGVFIGTFISTAATSLWVEPYVLYKYQLKTPVRKYFEAYAFYAIVQALAGYVTYCVCGLVSGSYVKVLALRLVICLIVPNVIMLIAFCRKKEFRFAIEKAAALLGRRR